MKVLSAAHSIAVYCCINDCVPNGVWRHSLTSWEMCNVAARNSRLKCENNWQIRWHSKTQTVLCMCDMNRCLSIINYMSIKCLLLTYRIQVLHGDSSHKKSSKTDTDYIENVCIKHGEATTAVALSATRCCKRLNMQNVLQTSQASNIGFIFIGLHVASEYID